MQNMKVTFPESIEIKIPGILKGHAGDAKRVGAHSLQEKVPTSKTKALFRWAA
jgi:hypothetical protein